MSIEEDYDPGTAANMQAEMKRFGTECRYDPTTKKIVYRTDEAALRAYLTLQREEMDRHKWIESEKANHDLHNVSLLEWVQRHSAAFSGYWHRTHVFVPPEKADSPR
jgi:hypothetical protein